MTSIHSQIGIVEEEIIQKLWVSFVKSLSNLKNRESQMERLHKHLEENTFPSNFQAFNYEKHFQLPETFSEDIRDTFHGKMTDNVTILKRAMLETLIEAYHVDLSNLRTEKQFLLSEDFIFAATDKFLPLNKGDQYSIIKSNVHLALNTKARIFLNSKPQLSEKQNMSMSPPTSPYEFPLTQTSESIIAMETNTLTQQQTLFRSPPHKKRSQPFSPDTNTTNTNMKSDDNIVDQLKVLTEKLAALETSVKNAQTLKNENDPTSARGRWIGGQNDGRIVSSSRRNSRSNSNNSRQQQQRVNLNQTSNWRGRTRSRTPNRSGSSYRGYRNSSRSRSPHQIQQQYWQGSRRGGGNNRGRGNRGRR